MAMRMHMPQTEIGFWNESLKKWYMLSALPVAKHFNFSGMSHWQVLWQQLYKTSCSILRLVTAPWRFFRWTLHTFHFILSLCDLWVITLSWFNCSFEQKNRRVNESIPGFFIIHYSVIQSLQWEKKRKKSRCVFRRSVCIYIPYVIYTLQQSKGFCFYISTN